MRNLLISLIFVGWMAPAPVHASPVPPPTAGAFTDLRPAKVDKGNAALPVVHKKRSGGTHELPTKELLIKWFTELGVLYQVDAEGRMLLPFRNDAAGLNLNVVVIVRAKPAGNLWLIQAAIPIGVPVPPGDAGLRKALQFANAWNNENFLLKASVMTPTDGAPFFLLDSALPCEDGLSRGEFFQNFLGLLLQSSQSFIARAAAAMAS